MKRMISCRRYGDCETDRLETAGSSPEYWKQMTLLFFLPLQARIIFDKATKVNFKHVEDLATVWCEYTEMELRHE